MNIALGPLGFSVVFWAVVLDLRIGSHFASLEVGWGDGRWFNAHSFYDDGQVHWQFRRGVVRHCLIWGRKTWEGSRYWTDNDLVTAAPKLPPA